MYCIGVLYPIGYHRPSTSLLWFHSCVLGCASSYLCDLCLPVSDVAACRVLRSATEGELLIPRAHLAIMHRPVHSLRNNSLRQIYNTHANTKSFLNGRYISSQNE